MKARVRAMRLYWVLTVYSLLTMGCGGGIEGTGEGEGSSHISGESSSTSTSTTGPGFDRVANPSGSVTGLVQDAHGNPIENATAYLAGQSTSTDAGGVYFFETIFVVQPVAYEGTPPHAPLLVSVVPPQGFLGATVMITAADQLTGDPVIDHGLTHPQAVFIDGFLAEADPLRLPMLSGCITGTLVSAVSGQALPEVELKAQFAGLWPSTPNPPPPTANVSYAKQEVKSTTDAGGNFRFEGLANNALWHLQAQIHDPETAELFVPGITDSIGSDNLSLTSAIVSLGFSITEPCLQLGELLLEPNASGKTLPLEEAGEIKTSAESAASSQNTSVPDIDYNGSVLNNNGMQLTGASPESFEGEYRVMSAIVTVSEMRVTDNTSISFVMSSVFFGTFLMEATIDADGDFDLYSPIITISGHQDEDGAISLTVPLLEAYPTGLVSSRTGKTTSDD